MAHYLKQGNNFYVGDPQGYGTLVTDPDTVKSLKSGLLPYQSLSIDRSLSFGENTQASPSAQQSNTQNLNSGGTEAPASTSLKGGQDINTLFQTKLMEALNGLTSSKLPALQARQRQIQTQMLTAPTPDLSQMTPSAGTQALRGRGQEYAPALEEVTQAIGQEKSIRSEDLQVLSEIANLAKLLSPDSAKQTTDILNYEYAVKSGYKGNFTQWTKEQANLKIPASAKPPTEAERRAFGFQSRAQDAENILAGIEDDIQGLGTGGQIRLQFAPNFLQTSQGQEYNQAKRQFVEAYLRKDSGAQISPEEFNRADLTYFVQPGDGVDVIKRKRDARKTILNSLKTEAGNAYKESYGESSSGVQDYILINPKTKQRELFKDLSSSDLADAKKQGYVISQ